MIPARPRRHRFARSLVLAAAVAAVTLLTAAPALPQAAGGATPVRAPELPAQAQAEREVTVMTRNLYLGASLDPIFEATDPLSLTLAAGAVWQQVLQTDFPTRAGALADEVAEHRPDLIGLQEVSLWRSGPLGAVATDVEMDFLEVLLAALADRGMDYAPVATVTAFDAQLPVVTIGREVRLTDRGVILARGDARRSELGLSNPQGGLFDTRLALEVFEGVELSVPRGWTSVDVQVRGKRFRFLNTHLEAFAEPIRLAQAQELLAGPADTDLPVVLVGDVNSPAEPPGPTYAVLASAGFADAWALARPGEAGHTCCHDDDLRNPEPALDRRIDVVLLRGRFGVGGAALVGADPDERVFSPVAGTQLWPSDHAGVVATLALPPSPTLPPR